MQKIFYFFGKIDNLEKNFFVYPSGTRVLGLKLLTWAISLINLDIGGGLERIPGLPRVLMVGIYSEGQNRRAMRMLSGTLVLIPHHLVEMIQRMIQ